MAYNYDNTYCASCEVWVWKGTGRWYRFPFTHTLCADCATVRDENRRKKAAKKKAAKTQLRLPLE
jgi:hypothetical protein